MKISRSKFVIVFVVSAFVFQFIANSLLGSEVQLFPADGVWFPGTDSSIAWKSTVAAIIYPVKFVLIGPLAAFFGVTGEEGAPPVIALAFAFYWTAIALVLHFLLSKIFALKK